MLIIWRFPSGMELILFFYCDGKSSIIISKISSRRFIISYPNSIPQRGNSKNKNTTKTIPFPTNDE